MIIIIHASQCTLMVWTISPERGHHGDYYTDGRLHEAFATHLKLGYP